MIRRGFRPQKICSESSSVNQLVESLFNVFLSGMYRSRC